MKIPEISDQLATWLVGLTVAYDGWLPEAAYQLLQSASGDKPSVSWTSWHESNGHIFRVAGHLSVFDVRKEMASAAPDEGDTEATGFLGHYLIRLNERPERGSSDEGAWTAVAGPINSILGSHAVHIRLELMIPDGLAKAAFHLPVALGATEIAGFTAIDGVRLVNVSPDNPEEELYSVILQADEKDLQVTASTTAALEFNDMLIATAIERGFHVARLATVGLE